MYEINLKQVALALLREVKLPYGVATILPLNEEGKMVMHVLIDPQYISKVSLPPTFCGHKVVVEPRTSGVAHTLQHF